MTKLVAFLVNCWLGYYRHMRGWLITVDYMPNIVEFWYFIDEKVNESSIRHLSFCDIL